MGRKRRWPLMPVLIELEDLDGNVMLDEQGKPRLMPPLPIYKGPGFRGPSFASFKRRAEQVMTDLGEDLVCQIHPAVFGRWIRYALDDGADVYYSYHSTREDASSAAALLAFLERKFGGNEAPLTQPVYTTAETPPEQADLSNTSVAPAVTPALQPPSPSPSKPSCMEAHVTQLAVEVTPVDLYEPTVPMSPPPCTSAHEVAEPAEEAPLSELLAPPSQGAPSVKPAEGPPSPSPMSPWTSCGPRQSAGQSRPPLVCWGCNLPGHRRIHCPSDRQQQTFRQHRESTMPCAHVGLPPFMPLPILMFCQWQMALFQAIWQVMYFAAMNIMMAMRASFMPLFRI